MLPSACYEDANSLKNVALSLLQSPFSSFISGDAYQSKHILGHGRVCFQCYRWFAIFSFRKSTSRVLSFRITWFGGDFFGNQVITTFVNEVISIIKYYMSHHFSQESNICNPSGKYCQWACELLSLSSFCKARSP